MSDAPEPRRTDKPRARAPQATSTSKDGAPAEGVSRTARPTDPASKPATPKPKAAATTSGNASSAGRSSSPASPASAASASPPARPARPQAPAKPVGGQRLEGVLEEDVQSIESVLPSGLSASTYLPRSRTDPDKLMHLRLQRQYDFRQTVLPTALVLTISMLLMAGGWFLLDPSSALRDNALGTTIPLTLLLLGIGFGIICALLMIQAASLRRRMTAEAEN